MKTALATLFGRLFPRASDHGMALGQRHDFVQAIHSSTKRDYVARVVDYDKAFCAEIAGQFGPDYWDGERHHGYGGYVYDGRWRPVAKLLTDHYDLRPGMRVLDVGCGKAHLLYELTQIIPGIEVVGLDISEYAIANAKEELRGLLYVGDAAQLPFPNDSFDLIISLATLHNLHLESLWSSVAEIERVARGAKYLMTESYRDEREKVNLLYWQLTCRSFYSVDDWEWLYRRIGYTGDYGFIFFD